jgi:hypothetical protein
MENVNQCNRMLKFNKWYIISFVSSFEIRSALFYKSRILIRSYDMFKCKIIAWPTRLLRVRLKFPTWVGCECILLINCFFISNIGGWTPTRSTRHVGHQLAYCTCPGWLWGWRIWWNDDWQGKPKYSEKTCPIATSSTTNPTWPDAARTRATAVGSQRLTPWAVHGQYTLFLSAPNLLIRINYLINKGLCVNEHACASSYKLLYCKKERIVN